MQTFRDVASMPPRHVYSAVLSNQTSSAIKVAITYQVPPDGHPESVEFNIEAGGSAEVPQKLVEQGSMTMTAHIIQVNVNDGAAVENAPLGIWSPTKNYPIEIFSDGDKIGIRQPNREPNA